MAPILLLALLGGGLVAAAAAASSPAPKKPAVPASPAKAALGGTLAGGKLVMSVGPATTLDPATEQALAVLKEATTPNRNWGTPGSAVNTLAATIRYAGGTSDAPPRSRESRSLTTITGSCSGRGRWARARWDG